ncbi:disease resistance protein SUMM2-like [Vigna angularis]|uniref:disease resistance protein SUMM2-like n=1 Tax=Phaseolus angularis TaxID=3914 RepID=UPI0022B3B9F0|nr:disease resistance protein SUMM2-like [Vigna angularis]
MVSIVSDLAKSNLEKLINATVEQSRYICCFTCIIDNFEKERENLKAKNKTLEESARVATRRGDNIRKDVTHWQKQAKELIEEDTKKKVTCFFGWCPNCKWQYSRGKELESKTKEIRRLVERNFENVGISRDDNNYISLESRKLKFEELFNALKDDNNYMIGLQGMGGTGKTTLVIEVGKELKKSKCYNQVIDTTISNTPDITKIQDDIAGPLGLPLKDFNESERPKKLKDRLTNGEKIILILDDVWGDINFEEIGIPFKGNHNNCRILVITRNMKICQQMDCDKTIELHILPEKEGWILFQKYAGLSDNSSKSILDRGRKISKECKGLPIAIAFIARSLKGPRPLEEWDVALKSLQKSMHVHDNEDESRKKVYTCLKYSYDNMKDETAKKLFLLCSLFREDEEISEELLVRLAKGATLIEKIDDDDSYDECRKKVIVAKNKLIDSCLLLNCKYERVKMYDLVREMALWIANEEIVAVNTSKKNEMKKVEKGKDIKYLLYEGEINGLFYSKFDRSKLVILIVYTNKYGDVEVPNSFFENIEGLQVLILSNTYFELYRLTSTPSLSFPQSIQRLTNMKSLYLKKFKLGDISIIGNLQALETLELVECMMNKLPREIGKLVNLKLLKLNYCHFESSNVFEVIRSCSSLEELHLVTTDDNKIFKDCHLQLPNYQRFCIGEHSVSENFYLEWLLRNSLHVDNAMKIFSQETLKNLVQRAEILRLSGPLGVWKNLIPDIIFPEDESTSNLMEIALADNSQLTCLIDNNDSLVQSALSRRIV